jgi:hypothetical protein
MTKTCGECKHFDRVLGICDLTDDFSTVISNTLACVDFEICPKPTNGDNIRQMSNEELSVMLSDVNFLSMISDLCHSKECSCVETCKDSVLGWLNAPADCVAENGESAKQTDLCCKIETESEGEDEP